MIIEAKDAKIKTAQVEIKSLIVSGKQVTLAVFRQLEERPLLGLDSFKENGVPWGRVNYHPDKCSDDDKHHHVIWQSGESLYRNSIPASMPPTAIYNNLLNLLEEELLSSYVFSTLENNYTIDNCAAIRYNGQLKVRADHNILLDINLPRELSNCWKCKNDSYYKDQLVEFSKTIKRPNDIERKSITNKINSYTEYWSTFINKINKLEHLFIAV